jgi:hypothetical protein
VTAEQLQQRIITALHDHPDIVRVREVATIYNDRLGLAAEDRDGRLWRVHVLTEPTQ